MNRSNLWELLGKKLNGEASPDELRQIEQLMRDEPVRSYLIELVSEIWRKKPYRNEDAEEQQLAKRWESLSNRLLQEDGTQEITEPQLPPAGRKIPILKMAAAVLLVAGATVFFFIYRHRVPVNGAVLKKHEIIVGNGERRNITLPDGTNLWLNGGSHLIYTDSFARYNRDVWLEGEAFFDVKKNAAQPFIVHTDHMNIKVLGTMFNVRAYKNDIHAEATLVQGKIEVSMKEDKAEKVVLSGREKFIIGATDVPLQDSGIVAYEYRVQAIRPVTKDTSLITETAWVERKLAFSEEPFADVAHKMERWYNVRIHLENERIKGVLMSGVFEQESVEQALNVLKMMVGFRYTIEGNDIYIR